MSEMFEPLPAAANDGPALAGDLARFPAADLLQFVGFLGISGELVFTRGDGEDSESVRCRVRRGRLVQALTDMRHLRLGELLVRRYEVALDAVLESLRAQNQSRMQGRTPTALGEILLHAGRVRPEVLRDALDEAATRILCAVLAWPSGRFEYWPGDGAIEREVFPEVALEDLVLERWHAADRLGARRT